MMSRSRIVGTEPKISASAHDDGVRPAAQVAGEQAQRHAEQQAARGHGGDGDDDGRLRGPDRAREQVAAQCVGAERVRPARRGFGVGEVGFVEAVRRDERREDAGAVDDHDHDDRDDRDGPPRRRAQTRARGRIGLANLHAGGDVDVAHVCRLPPERTRGSMNP